MSTLVFVTSLLLVSATPSPASAGCEADPAAHALDFWIGDWTVRTADGAAAGTNRVEKLLKGCAVLEHWAGADGSEGKSLFFYERPAKRWKQVWVTEDTGVPGGLKEKRLVSRTGAGGVRFQGELALASGDVILDRTTLTPEAGGKVRQLIEVSRDGGASWRSSFDAVYERAVVEPAKTCASPEHRQFDFWIGDWDVTGPDGSVQGTNRVESILHGCVLLENWSGAGGTKGRSFNFYVPAEREWKQSWVDDSGGQLLLAGTWHDGKMDLVGEGPSRRDPKLRVRNRITWEKRSENEVRQLWTRSTDGGATFTTAFDGRYVRKGSTPAPHGASGGSDIP